MRSVARRPDSVESCRQIAALLQKAGFTEVRLHGTSRSLDGVGVCKLWDRLHLHLFLGVKNSMSKEVCPVLLLGVAVFSVIVIFVYIRMNCELLTDFHCTILFSNLLTCYNQPSMFIPGVVSIASTITMDFTQRRKALLLTP